MVQSKEWDWEKGSEYECWSVPSEDVYFYLSSWKQKRFRRLLDLGCGIGRHSILFAENGFNVDALDLSQEGLEMLRAKAEKQKLDIKTCLGDMNGLPYADETFDCLLAYHSISHTDSTGIKKIIGEIGRVLKENGEFYVTLCSKESPSYKDGKHPRLDENTIMKTEGPEVDVPHYYSDLGSVRDLLREFEIIRIRHIQDIFDDSYSWHYFIHGKNTSK